MRDLNARGAPLTSSGELIEGVNDVLAENARFDAKLIAPSNHPGRSYDDIAELDPRRQVVGCNLAEPSLDFRGEVTGVAEAPGDVEQLDFGEESAGMTIAGFRWLERPEGNAFPRGAGFQILSVRR